MRVLFVADISPWPPNSGTRIRNLHLLRGLRRHHEVQLAVLEAAPGDASHLADMPAGTQFFPLEVPGAKPPALTGWAERLQTWKEAFGTWRTNIVRESDSPRLAPAAAAIVGMAADCDVVLVSRPYFASALLRAGLRKPFVIDYNDITTTIERTHMRLQPRNLYRFYLQVDVLKLYAFEQLMARRAWRSMVCKEEDRRFFRLARHKVHVVPNGTAVRPASDPALERPSHLFFVGTMSYPPNADAVSWFAREMLPTVAAGCPPEHPVRLDVVGQDPPDYVRELADGRTVFVHGRAASLDEFYGRAEVVVAPIRKGSGTKLKVMEALSYGKATVATTEAARGLDLRPGIDYERADTPAEFAAACLALLRDPGRRARLGRSGRERVHALYAWDSIGDLAARIVAGAECPTVVGTPPPGAGPA